MGEAWSNQLISLLVLSLPGGFTGIFGYSPSPGAGNLVISITNQAGTDPYGNPYPAGICVGPSSGPQVNISGGNPATVSYPLNDAAFAVDPASYAAITGGGVNRYASLVSDGPKLGPGAHDDYVELQLNSPNADGSSTANASISYVDTSAVFHGYLVIDYRGVNLLASVMAAMLPGTGTSAANPAQPEGWHLITLDAGWAGVANYIAPSYRLTSDGMLQLAGNANQSWAAGGAKNLNGSNPLPAAYRPGRTSDFRSGDLVGNRCHVAINAAGIITAFPPSGATFPGTYNCEIDTVIRLL